MVLAFLPDSDPMEELLERIDPRLAFVSSNIVSIYNSLE